ncbi:MAG: hypothetical protein GEV12_22330 [Micromonosporaceae bacterium]|nr:hypothetical protein [Micromonosporaceae bacterium]
MAGPGAAHLRLLLLLAVACGVVQMHILGHASDEHGGYADQPLEAGHAMAGPYPPSGEEPEGGGVPGPERPVDPLAVCLAIVTTVGLTAAVVFLWTRRAVSRLAGVSRQVARGMWWGRGPPFVVPPLGRRIAALSVLRI